MSLLSQNGSPGERDRGLIFVETFKNASEVLKNGATIGGGTPTFTPGAVTFDGASYLNYPVGNASLVGLKPMSIDIELTAASAAGAQIAYIVGAVGAAAGAAVGVGINAGKWCAWIGGGVAIDSGIAVVVGQKTRVSVTYNGVGGGPMDVYTDGVWRVLQGVAMSFVPPTIYMGGFGAASYYTGQIHSVRLFTQQLSPEEVAQYATNRVFSYRSQPTIYLPMRNVDHTATLTKDVSGNGRDGVFGAGAATPTKLVGRHGYDFNLASAQYMAATLNGAFNTSEITVAVEFAADYAYNGGANSFLWDASNLARCYCYKDAAGNIRFAAGNTGIFGWAAATTAVHWRQTGTMTIVAALKSGRNNAWFNGNWLLVNDATAWVFADPATATIGSSYDTLNNHDGRITRFASWPSALTPIAVYDLLSNWQMRASEV